MSLTDVQQYPTLTSTELVRDVEPFLDLILKNYPVMSLLTVGGTPCVNHTHEWFDDIIEQQTTTLTANITAHAASATGITITLTDSSIFQVGDQVYIETLDPIYEVTGG